MGWVLATPVLPVLRHAHSRPLPAFREVATALHGQHSSPAPTARVCRRGVRPESGAPLLTLFLFCLPGIPIVALATGGVPVDLETSIEFLDGTSQSYLTMLLMTGLANGYPAL